MLVFRKMLRTYLIDGPFQVFFNSNPAINAIQYNGIGNGWPQSLMLR